MRRISVLLFLVACNSSTTVTPIDAPKPTADASVQTSCTNPVPTTAPDGITLSGEVSDGSPSGAGLANATITAFAGGVARGSTISEVSGVFQLDVTTGGLPVEYLAVSASGYRDARMYPRVAIDHSSSLATFPLYSTADAATFISMFGVTQDPAKGLAIIAVSDCFDTPAENAVVTVAPAGGTVKYLHADGSTTGAATDSTGTAAVFNIPAGSASLNAAVGATPDHAVAIAASPSYLVIATIAEQ